MKLQEHTADKWVIGVIHLPPMPGTPFYNGEPVTDIAAAVVRSVRALVQGGASGCLIQTADRVYAADQRSDPARTASLAIVLHEVRASVPDGFTVGIQVMQNDIRTSLALAKLTGAEFIRAGVFVGQSMSNGGMIIADPMGVMEYVRKIGAETVKIFADVHTRHFRWQGSDWGVEVVSKKALDCGAFGVCLEDQSASKAKEMIQKIKATSPDLPVIISGYTDVHSASALLADADGVFVGKAFESNGWGSEIDADAVKRYVQAVQAKWS